MASGKVRVKVDVTTESGIHIYKQMIVPARLLQANIQRAPEFSEVALRLVMSNEIAENLFMALDSATEINLSVTGVP